MIKLVTMIAALVAATAWTSNLAHSADDDHSKAMTVFKTPWCGCCQSWIEAVEKAGYVVKSKDMEDLSLIKKQASVPEHLEACHTAVMDGPRKYVLEGHVPLDAIEKLMTERPDIRGISTPGMPNGSLGMGFDPAARYTVYAFTGASNETPVPFYEAGVK